MTEYHRDAMDQMDAGSLGVDWDAIASEHAHARQFAGDDFGNEMDDGFYAADETDASEMDGEQVQAGPRVRTDWDKHDEIVVLEGEKLAAVEAAALTDKEARRDAFAELVAEMDAEILASASELGVPIMDTSMTLSIGRGLKPLYQQRRMTIGRLTGVLLREQMLAEKEKAPKEKAARKTRASMMAYVADPITSKEELFRRQLEAAEIGIAKGHRRAPSKTAAARRAAKVQPEVLAIQAEIDRLEGYLVAAALPVVLAAAILDNQSFGGGVKDAYYVLRALAQEACEFWEPDSGLRWEECVARFLKKEVYRVADKESAVMVLRGVGTFMNAMQRQLALAGSARNKTGATKDERVAVDPQKVLDDIIAYYQGLGKDLPAYWTLSHVERHIAADQMRRMLRLDAANEEGKKMLLESDALESFSVLGNDDPREIRAAVEDYYRMLMDISSVVEMTWENQGKAPRTAFPKLYTVVYHATERNPNVINEMIAAKEAAMASGVEGAFEGMCDLWGLHPTDADIITEEAIRLRDFVHQYHGG